MGGISGSIVCARVGTRDKSKNEMMSRLQAATADCQPLEYNGKRVDLQQGRPQGSQHVLAAAHSSAHSNDSIQLALF